MTLDIQRKCVVMRSGMEFWISLDEAQKLEAILMKSEHHKFIAIAGETINTADLAGIFAPITLDDYHRQKRGYWKCDFDKWHPRNQDCNCALNRARLKAVELPPEVRPNPETKLAIEAARDKLAKDLSR